MRYRDWVVRLAHRWTGDQHQALDVLQDAFLYVLRHLPEIELRARFTTLLYPVVRHLSLASQRRGGRESPANECSEPEAPTEDAPSQLEDLAHVLGSLPDGQRAVVLLRYVDELSLAEVAATLDIPLGTVKSRLHQALQVLREDPRLRAYFLDEL